MDPVVAILAFLLGAVLAYTLDEMFGLTTRLTTWLGRWMDEA
jgi:hypothetical protein